MRSISLVFMTAFSLLALHLPFATSASLLGSSAGISSLHLCKCLCFGNSTILPLYLPKDPLHPCQSCTRQFCLEQKLSACLGAELGQGGEDGVDGTGAGAVGDVEARCFQRDSPKSHVLVLLFIIITTGLLIGAGLKHKGFDILHEYKTHGFGGMIRSGIESAQAFVQNRRTRGGGYGMAI